MRLYGITKKNLLFFLLRLLLFPRQLVQPFTPLHLHNSNRKGATCLRKQPGKAAAVIELVLWQHSQQQPRER